MGFVIELIFNFAMEVIMYNIGRAAIFVCSLGNARAENLKEMFSNDTWHHDQADGKIVIPATATTVIGVILFSISSLLFFTYIN